MRDYNCALVAAVVEYIVEYMYVPWFRVASTGYISLAALFVLLFGQIIRTTAVMTAGKAFTHYIMESKRKEHKLVTTGIYRYEERNRMLLSF